MVLASLNNFNGTMKYLITETQFKLLSELERNWRDFEYEEQYQKIKDKLITIIGNKIESYSDDENYITLYDKRGDKLIVFSKYKNEDDTDTGEIFYDSGLSDKIEKILPHPLWLVHGKYIISDVFNYYFPDKEVKHVRVVGFSN